MIHIRELRPYRLRSSQYGKGSTNFVHIEKEGTLNEMFPKKDTPVADIKGKNYFMMSSWNPLRCDYLYVDKKTEDPKELFKSNNVDVKVRKVLDHPEHDFSVVFVRTKKKEAPAFVKLMNKINRKNREDIEYPEMCELVDSFFKEAQELASPSKKKATAKESKEGLEGQMPEE